MSRTASEEEIQLRKRARRRLIGAITLVIAAIVFLPMLLDSKPERRSQEIDIRIPPEDHIEPFGTEDTTSGGISLDSTTASAIGTETSPAESAPSEQQSAPAAVKPNASTQSAKVVQPEEGTKAGKGTETGKSSATPASGIFVVQLGAFSNPAKARQQLATLISRNPEEYARHATGAGATAYTETLKADKGQDKSPGKAEVTRVRIGPFTTREQADAALAKLKLQGFDGVVTDK